jgi:hypothetical protein
MRTELVRLPAKLRCECVCVLLLLLGRIARQRLRIFRKSPYRNANPYGHKTALLSS